MTFEIDLCLFDLAHFETNRRAWLTVPLQMTSRHTYFRQSTRKVTTQTGGGDDRAYGKQEQRTFTENIPDVEAAGKWL